jgi:hypothetical protein
MNKIREAKVEHIGILDKDNVLYYSQEYINQNYILKEEILGLECLKEEKEWTLTKFKNLMAGDRVIRNQLRNEIKEAINNLKK